MMSEWLWSAYFILLPGDDISPTMVVAPRVPFLKIRSNLATPQPYRISIIGVWEQAGECPQKGLFAARSWRFLPRFRKFRTGQARPGCRADGGIGGEGLAHEQCGPSWAREVQALRRRWGETPQKRTPGMLSLMMGNDR